MLYILKSFYNTLIVYPKEKRATQSVSKSTNAFQPTFRLLLLKL
mgnify:CR=1 FL=1